MGPQVPEIKTFRYEIRLSHCRLWPVWRHLCMEGAQGGQGLSGDRQAPPSRRQRVLRERRGHQRAQIRRPHLPYVKQGGVGFRQRYCGIQPLHQFARGQLRGQALQSAVQHEHVLSDVGRNHAGRSHRQNRRAEGRSRGADAGRRSHRAPQPGGAGAGAHR